MQSKAKFIACRKCHARKVKCPGGHPCQTCVQMSCETECIYLRRDRQVRVSESYFESLVQQNQLLRAHLQTVRGSGYGVAAGASSSDETPLEPITDPIGNPLLEESPWFVSLTPFHVPLRVGEAASTAFASRFRQTLSKALSNTKPDHLPRLSYPSEHHMKALSESELRPISVTQARFLVQTAFANIDKSLHIVRKHSIWVLLEPFAEAPMSLDFLLRCKILALFALGEVYSSNYRASENNAPGLSYFSHAFKAHGHLLERPCIDSIEVSLLLCLYSLCINRWHSAYFLASSAIRHCVAMGLNFNMPETQLNSCSTREHLTRVWWTSYILDSTCAALSGQVASIHDDDVFVSIPSSKGISGSNASDFEDPDCISARISLVKLSKDVIKTIYWRGKHEIPFLQRVQAKLKELKFWAESLPETLKLNYQELSTQEENVKSLHLFFNETMMIATRPLLLCMLRLQLPEITGDPNRKPPHIPGNLSALAETCVQCARHSNSLLTHSWISGSFKIFDYFYVQYLFSSTTILALSSILSGLHYSRDWGEFEVADQLLKRLSDSGSLPAMEFYQHVEKIKADLQHLSPKVLYPCTVSTETIATNENMSFQSEFPDAQSSRAITSDMALSYSPLEAFLLQTESSLGDTDAFNMFGSDELYWPMVEIPW